MMKTQHNGGWMVSTFAIVIVLIMSVTILAISTRVILSLNRGIDSYSERQAYWNAQSAVSVWTTAQNLPLDITTTYDSDTGWDTGEIEIDPTENKNEGIGRTGPDSNIVWRVKLPDQGSGGQPGTVYTFTNCGKEGPLGPSQNDCNGEYQGTSLQGIVDVTEGIQEWTVQQTDHYTIQAFGAQGGAGTSNGGVPGGLGARMKGEFYLSAGSKLYILIGQQADGISHHQTQNAGGGGGGGTFVVLESDDPLLVAGGGGGTGANTGVVQLMTHGQSGESGARSSVNFNFSQNGEGGNSGYDGAGGGGFSTDGVHSQTVGLGGKSFLNGGAGGGFRSSGGYPSGVHMGYGGFGGGGGVGHAGGGGGGYSGGNGSGQYGNGSWTGGGGSFNAGQNQETEAGNNSGHGKVIITVME